MHYSVILSLWSKQYKVYSNLKPYNKYVTRAIWKKIKMTLQPLETISESLSSSHIATMSKDDEPEVYTIIRISGKGMGMVANTDIPPGKLIIEEKPLLSVPLTASGDLPGRVR